MSAFKDLAGQTKGRLTALRDTGRRDKHGHAIWLFHCACDGKEIEIRGRDFVSGKSRSCGCLNRELAAVRCRNRWTGLFRQTHPAFKHGHGLSTGASPTYRSWTRMLTRCLNPNYQHFRFYGGANPPITVCERWRTFENFLADMGERPEGTSLGRFGDVGNYEPGNCAWQTRKEQGAERRKHHRALEDQVLDEIFGVPQAA